MTILPTDTELSLLDKFNKYFSRNPGKR